MDHKSTSRDDLKYVVGCLYFCVETLAQLGYKDLAQQIARTCAALAPMLGDEKDEPKALH